MQKIKTTMSLEQIKAQVAAIGKRSNFVPDIKMVTKGAMPAPPLAIDLGRQKTSCSNHI